MVRILGIDYGRKKIGIALATELLAEPYKVIRYERIDEALRKIKGIVKNEGIDHIVVGISEGEMAKETKKFARKLEEVLQKKVFFQDETLSSFEANRLASQLKLSRKKKRDFEDAFAAAIILQNYLNLKLGK